MLQELIGDGSGAPNKHLQPLAEYLQHDVTRADGVLSWIYRSPMSRVVRDMASGTEPLSLRTVAKLPQTNATGYLAALLMDSGTLPMENFDRIRMEVWQQQHCDSLHDQQVRNLIRQYSAWVINPLFGDPLQPGDRSQSSRLSRSKADLLQVTDFLHSAKKSGYTIHEIPQRFLDAYRVKHRLTRGQLTRFIRWAKERGFTRLESQYAQSSPNAPSISDDKRWEWIRSLSHSDHYTLTTRVAGLFCLIYGLRMTRVIALRKDDILRDPTRVQVLLGRDPIELPCALASLLIELMDHNAVAFPYGNQWVFPGKQPGRHLTCAAVSGHLNRAGINLARGKGAAMMYLSRQVPASVLSDLLGISLAASTRWSALSARDWTDYPRLRLQSS